MGNKISELNQKIDRDKRSQVHHSYVKDLEEIQEGNVDQREIEREMKESMLDEAMNMRRVQQSQDNSRNMQMQKWKSLRQQFRSRRVEYFLPCITSPQITQFVPVKYNWQQYQRKQLIPFETEPSISILTKIQNKIFPQTDRRSQNYSSNDNLGNQDNLRSIQPQIFYCYDKTSRKITVQKISVCQEQIKQIIQRQLTAKDFQQQTSNNPSTLQPSNYLSFKQQLHKVNSAIYQWRLYLSSYYQPVHSQSLPIVHVYAFFQPSRFNISVSRTFQIYQEHIPHRLNQVGSLTHLQGLYVLEEAIKGFMMLFQVFGYFIITQNMIGFNLEGKVKVWISELFWSNLCISRPAIPSATSQNMDHIQLDQRQLVTSIYLIVQKYTLFHESLIKQSHGFRYCNFKETLQIINKHKNSIIDQRNIGNVQFVNRINFSSVQERDQLDNAFFRNNIGIQKEIQRKQVKTGDINEKRKDMRKFQLDRQKYNPISRKRQTNPQQFYHHGPQIPTQTTTSFFSPSINTPHSFNTAHSPRENLNKTSLSTVYSPNHSHIHILHKDNHSSHSIKRPLIFDKGYNKSMSNNQNNSNFEQFQRNNQSVSDSYDRHVQFVNIKSVVKV